MARSFAKASQRATSVWTKARLRLLGFLKERQAGATNEVECIGFDEAVELYKRAIENDNAIKQGSKGYRLTR
jgi:hypothetical protein